MDKVLEAQGIFGTVLREIVTDYRGGKITAEEAEELTQAAIGKYGKKVQTAYVLFWALQVSLE